MSTINGSGAATQNRESISYTPNVGGEYGGRYEGPYAAIKSKMTTLIAAGYACKFECDASPIATLEFSTPTAAGNPGGVPVNPNADYTDNFQVLRNTVQKELLLSDHPLVAGLVQANLEQLKDIISQNPKIVFDADHVAVAITGTRTVTSGRPISSASKAQYLLDLHLSGVRSVEVKQPVLRVTRITNPAYDAPFYVGNVDKVLTSARMIRDSRVPSNFAVPLLGLAAALMRRTAVNGSGYAVRTDYIGLKYGWLKDAVTSETVGTTKNQYVLEYKFGLWDVETYGQPLT